MWGSGRQMSARIEASGEPFGVEQGRIAGTRLDGRQATRRAQPAWSARPRSFSGALLPQSGDSRRSTATVTITCGRIPSPTPAGTPASAVAWRQERR